MKIELSLTSDYTREWGLWEGIREMVQNAKDGEIEHGASMEHTFKNETLTLINRGVTLPREALLIGFSTKQKNKDTLGQFGEGLKLGTLALCRAGYTVNIRNGSETWTPSIERSEKFDREVLVFHVRKRKKEDKDLSINIKGIPEDVWKSYKKNFLFFERPQKVTETMYGDVLEDPGYQGHIYLKGIYVTYCQEITYGYDIKTNEIMLDRDRKMVNDFELEWTVSQIWKLAARQNEFNREKVFKMLEDGDKDLDKFINALHFEPALSEFVKEKFKYQYGDKAFPVSSIAESKELENLGAQGIVCNDNFKNAMQTVLGNYNQFLYELKKTNYTLVSWHELESFEKNNYTAAITLLKTVVDMDENTIVIADYDDPKIMGKFNNGIVYMARNTLKNAAYTLSTLAHEYMHHFYTDNEVWHIYSTEDLLAKIAVDMYQEYEEAFK